MASKNEIKAFEEDFERATAKLTMSVDRSRDVMISPEEAQAVLLALFTLLEDNQNDG